MSKNAAKALRQDMEYMGSIPHALSEAAQNRIIAIARRLEETGEIVVAGGVFYSHHLHSLKSVSELEEFLTKRKGNTENQYGIYDKDITMCSFFNSPGSDRILADIEQKNNELGMGNVKIPNTNIKLINYSVCPKCGRVFNFKELADYYVNPRPDPRFKSAVEQYRQDTRVWCSECGAYFLPALILSDGTPRSEVQFLCRTQTMDAIEVFFESQKKPVLTRNPQNIVIRGGVKNVRNDVSLWRLESKPALMINLLQYTPAKFALNLIDGTNIQKNDFLFGGWNIAH
jgi:hypothetical protein